MPSKTTIEVSEQIRDKLKNARDARESNYDATLRRLFESANTQFNWQIEGTAHKIGLDALPDKITEMHETDEYAVFSDGETLLLKPTDEVEP